MNPMNDHALDPARLPKPRRDYKDTLFRLLFRDRNRLLSLYNAVNGTSCSSPEDLTVVTLENAVYMNMKNDAAFLPDLKRVYALCGTGAAPCKDYDLSLIHIWERKPLVKAENSSMLQPAFSYSLESSAT